MLQQVVLRLGIFLGGLVPSETVVSAFHTISKLQELGHRCFFICIIRAAAIPWISNWQPQTSFAQAPTRKHGFPTCQRTREETQPFHVPDAVASRPRFGRITSQRRMPLAPEALRGIGPGLGSLVADVLIFGERFQFSRSVLHRHDFVCERRDGVFHGS